MSEAVPQINSRQPEVNAISFASKLQRIQRESQPGGVIDQRHEQILIAREEANRQLKLIQDDILKLETENTALKAESSDIIERMAALDDDEVTDESMKESQELILRKRRQVVRASMGENKRSLVRLRDQEVTVTEHLKKIIEYETTLITRSEKISHALGVAAMVDAALLEIGKFDDLPEELLVPFTPDHIIEDSDLESFRSVALLDIIDGVSPDAIESIEVILPQVTSPPPEQVELNVETKPAKKTLSPAMITMDVKQIRKLNILN